MFNRVVDRAVGTGARAKLAKAAADNAIWMPVTTCLLFAALKLAQGEPEEIASGLQVSLPLRQACLKPWCIGFGSRTYLHCVVDDMWLFQPGTWLP